VPAARPLSAEPDCFIGLVPGDRTAVTQCVTLPRLPDTYLCDDVTQTDAGGSVDRQDRQERFEQGYRRHYGALVAYVLRRSAGSADAADVVAETFSVYWRRIDDAPVGNALLPWLYGVGRRTLANQRRGELRRTALNDRLAADIQVLPVLSPPTDGSRTAIDQAFRRLDDKDREILALVAWEALDREAVAVALGVNRAAVRVRLHRARQRFARELEKQGVEVTHFARTPSAGPRAATPHLET
jgi:RNA polymerase sigma factor (sigma-70 family)